MSDQFNQKLSEILTKDRRYKADAYEFVMQALWFTQKKLKRKGHVSGKELLEGIRNYGMDQYGPMTKVLFAHWGVKETADFGEIVFNMIECGLMGKTEEDTREEFKDVYNFDSALDVFNSRKTTWKK